MSSLAEEAVSNSLRDLVNKAAKANGFNDCKLQIQAINSGGGNFLGDLFTIDVVETGKDTLHLFSKVSNTPEKARAVIPARAVYEREVFVYTDLAKAFDSLQQKHDIPAEERFKFAKYYGSDLTDLQEMLLLENLSKKGYTMFDRKKSFDWEYARASLEQLAKFHALSFVLEIEEPESFERLIRNKNEFLVNRPRNKEKNGFEDYQAGILKNALNALEPRYHKTLVKLFDGLQEFWKQQLQPLRKKNVLVHGDYRVSNQMVKYEEGVLTSLVTVDYQTIFYGSPVNDIMYLLFSGSDAEFRRHHYEGCIQHYRSCLGRALAALGQDLEEVYPQQLFQEDLKDKMMYGLALAVFLLPIILVEAAEAPKISDIVDETKKQGPPQVNRLYGERLTGVFEDLVSWGAIALEN